MVGGNSSSRSKLEVGPNHQSKNRGKQIAEMKKINDQAKDNAFGGV